ncbi:MAG: beta-galactosidase [Candidatus Sumerlaeota bacterium]|nr:beta-galactosidase [Candidatus Sumerlaeota bacterium]
MPGAVRSASESKPAIAILREALPGAHLDVTDHLAAALRAAGYDVSPINGEQAADPALLDPGRFFLYVIPNAQVYPGAAVPALEKFLERKGAAMILGAPAFSRLAWRINGQWMDAQSLRETCARTKPDRILFDFEDEKQVKPWMRGTNAPDIPSGAERAAGGAGAVSVAGAAGAADGAGHCLKLWMKDMTGWTVWNAAPPAPFFGEGQTLLCFWAKGDGLTSQTAVEIGEKDGSRWIAVIPLEPQWRPYALSPEDFLYWKDSPTKDKRGGKGDQMNPAQAAKLGFGVSQSHTSLVTGGPHAIFIDKIGTAKNAFGEGQKALRNTPPVIETISPSYKVYRLHDIAGIACENSDFFPAPKLNDATLHIPLNAFSCHTRFQGNGIEEKSPWRWIPLLSAKDRGQERGYFLWALLLNAKPYEGAFVVACGVNDAAFYKSPITTSYLTNLAKRIGQGIFLQQGGTQYFYYGPEDKPIQLGARVLNRSQNSVKVKVTLANAPYFVGPVISPISVGSFFSKEEEMNIEPGASKSIEASWSPSKLFQDKYQVRIILSKDGEVIDIIKHIYEISPARKPAKDDFVSVRDGEFYLKGKPWRPVGVNFWPLSSAGLEKDRYNRHWLIPGEYDPDEIEKDLARLEKLGGNMVSIQTHPVDKPRNFMDFLRRCEKHNIKVNAFLSGASPLAFNEKAVADFLQLARLADNPTIFAYDIIWEPGNSTFDAANRPKWDGDWQRWIAERYGSLENAEKDWGMKAPRAANGAVTAPSDQQLRDDGGWRVMVAAYRRFMDDLMSRKYGDAIRALRRLDPNHLISFRQGNTLPHDYTLTATPKHIDFISPEGYAIQPGEDGYAAAGFITRFCKFTTRGKPVYWSEFGKSVWDNETMSPNAALFQWQANYEELFYRAALDAGAQGTAPWWWPGGYRVDERSDYGIMNQDGTPRPAALLMLKYSMLMQAARPLPKPDTWLTIDRDAHAGGYCYLAFHEGRDAYAQARKEGKPLGIKTLGTGTDSTNTPLVAVGNTPYTGQNPPKYLNAEFNWLKIKDAEGQWVEVKSGARIAVAKDAPVLALASVGNLQEAEWIAPETASGKSGAVYLSSTSESALKLKKPLPRNTPSLADADFGEFTLSPGIAAPTSVELQMTAEGRMWFGEKLSFALAPK